MIEEIYRYEIEKELGDTNIDTTKAIEVIITKINEMIKAINWVDDTDTEEET